MIILHTLHRAEQAATNLFAEYTNGSKITVRQAVIMDALHGHSGASQTRLVELTGVDRSTLADVVRRLKTKGWIDRRRTKADARTYAVKLTAEGSRQLALAKTAAVKTEKALVAQYPGVRALAK